jgi:hypothetical protein
MSLYKYFIKNEIAPLVSTSTWLTMHLTAFRNQSSNCCGLTQETCIVESLVRRVLGELGYAALLIASVVETVFRSFLSLLIIPFLCLIPKDCQIRHFFEVLSDWSHNGTIASFENILFTAAALVTNIFVNKLKPDPILNTVFPISIDINNALF